MRWLLVVLAACGSEKAAPPPAASPSPTHVQMPDAPKRLEFGDCAATNIPFVSGPKPAAFDAALLMPPGQIRTSTLGPGQGSGISVGHGRWVVVRIGKVSVEGNLDKNIIRRYLRREMLKLEECYDQIGKPLDGTINTSFTISATGATQDMKADGVDPTLASCVAGVLGDVEYPKPQGGGISKVKVTWTFKPPPKEEPGPPKDYDPQRRNPLVAKREAIAACIAKSPKPWGIAVVDLDTTTRVYGLDDATAACIALAAKPSGDDGVRRCSLAFGTMPPGDYPAIDIEGTKIRLRGTTVELAALGAAIDAPPTAPVTLWGPLVVRGDRAIADQVIAAAGTKDIVREADIGKLPPMPVVPVPFSTGTTWIK